MESIPQSQGMVAAVVGETWNWQLWYRDFPAVGSNFSMGYSLTLQ